MHLSTMLCPLLGHPPSQPPPPLQPPPPYQDGSRLSGLRYRDFLWINSQNEITNSSESFVDLLYCGQRLQDEKTLKEYSITTSSTIHILRRNFSDDDASAPGKLPNKFPFWQFGPLPLTASGPRVVVSSAKFCAAPQFLVGHRSLAYFQTIYSFSISIHWSRRSFPFGFRTVGPSIRGAGGDCSSKRPDKPSVQKCCK